MLTRIQYDILIELVEGEIEITNDALADVRDEAPDEVHGFEQRITELTELLATLTVERASAEG